MSVADLSAKEMRKQRLTHMHCWSQQNKLSIKRVVEGATMIADLSDYTAAVKQVRLASAQHPTMTYT